MAVLGAYLGVGYMKTVKTKLHQHHRKARAMPHQTAHIQVDDAPATTELEQQLYRLERSPKQENL
jgi:hypothetical protein